MQKLTHKERFIKALRRERFSGQVPTFELVFFLSLEAVGKVHPLHRCFSQWNQMTKKEQALQIKDAASVYVEVAKKYSHSAIFLHPTGDFDYARRLFEAVKEMTGDEYYLTMHGDPTYPIPDGSNMTEFSVRIYEEPEKILEEQRKAMYEMLEFSARLNAKDKLVDGITLCSDYCFNTNPFYSPDIFADLIAPVLAETIAGYRSQGLYTIKHTDGNIMPILQQIAQCKPDALHSIDPQGGVSLAGVAAKYGDKLTFCGNVNCGLLQTGTEDEAAADVRRSLREGMKSGRGYIFCTSNCAYTGLPLERYEMMIDIWRKEGWYS